MPNGKMALAILSRMGGGKKEESADEFTTAAKEFAKAIKAGSEDEIAQTLRACIDIAFTENEKQPHEENEGGI
jgi:hypothetical protein